jgi:hypothetical protein
MAAQQQETTGERPATNQELVDLWRQNACLHKQVQFLQFILTEREKLTENKYSDLKGRFNQMQDLAYRIFLENPTMGFTYEEATEEWERRYPNINSMNLPRRIRELSEMGLLWRSVDPVSGKVKHYVKKETANQKSPEDK